MRKKDSALPGGGRSFTKSGWQKDGEDFYHKAAMFLKKVRSDARFGNMTKKARTMWFNEMRKRSDNGRKRRQCGDNFEVEAQDLTAPTMEWDSSEDIRSYDV